MPRTPLFDRPACHDADELPALERSLRRVLLHLHRSSEPITVETIELWAQVIRHWPSADADSSERSSAAA